jgi:predicted small secreted protein
LTSLNLVRAVGGGLICGVSLAACNALTGVGDLDVTDEPRDVTEDADASALERSIVASDASVEDDAPGPMTNDGSDADVPPPDASADASLPESDAAPPCVPASVGPRYGTIAKYITPNTWSFRNGILAPGDGQFAHTNNVDGTIEVSGFGFALPANAHVRGIVVRIGRTAEGSVSDTVTLPKGTSKPGGSWPQGSPEGPYQYATYGGPTDTWGASWTSGEINAETFSVTLSVTGRGDGHADSIGVTVHYCD